jgi:organic hydroperoxide reductase OsmC/OhrA
MDMRGQKQRLFKVDMRHADGYRFISQAYEDGRLHGETFASDEPDPVGSASGPATPALLGAAIAHCLSASLLETLRHARLPVDDFQSEVTAVVAPNDDGLPRIDHVDVVLRPTLQQPAGRTGRCEEVFQKHCTVTSSVRDGIDVRVRVDWRYLDPADATAVADPPGNGARDTGVAGPVEATGRAGS